MQADKAAWYPPTAQHAIREGPALADNIVATLRGAPTKPFTYTSLGTMASLGARRGVAALPGRVRADRLSGLVLVALRTTWRACRASTAKCASRSTGRSG